MDWPHWLVMPIVAPLVAGAATLLLERRGARAVRMIAVATALGLLLLAVLLAERAADGTVRAYLLGNWAVPFGISLALDRLSALMLVLTAVVGLAGLLYAGGGDANRGAHFHSLMLFQMAGLNGAFLTADLFNLFVFFELLLIASYGLLLHGGGTQRLRAAIHYVAFNLSGSALFLVAVSMLYGLTGTLSMADLAQRIAVASPDDALLLRVAASMLLVVFCVKAALLPLYFWLPETYSAASAPAAAVFAIMTKVGVYAIARLTTLSFGPQADGPVAGVAQTWLPALALATLALGATGAVAAGRLRVQVAYLVVASAGTLITAVALGSAAALAAGLFYLVNSTLVACAMFLLVDRVAIARGHARDMISPARFGPGRAWLGSGFFLLALAFAGLPPFGGFLGKAMLLRAAGEGPLASWVWIVVLPAGLATIVALARAGSTVFWHPPAGSEDAQIPAASRLGAPGPTLAIGLLVVAVGGASLFAGSLSSYTDATARQLHEPHGYIDALLQARPVAPAWDVRKEMRERGHAKGAMK